MLWSQPRLLHSSVRYLIPSLVIFLQLEGNKRYCWLCFELTLQNSNLFFEGNVANQNIHQEIWVHNQWCLCILKGDELSILDLIYWSKQRPRLWSDSNDLRLWLMYPSPSSVTLQLEFNSLYVFATLRFTFENSTRLF